MKISRDKLKINFVYAYLPTKVAILKYIIFLQCIKQYTVLNLQVGSSPIDHVFLKTLALRKHLQPTGIKYKYNSSYMILYVYMHFFEFYSGMG